MIDCCVDGQFWFVCRLNSLYIGTFDNTKKEALYLSRITAGDIYIRTVYQGNFLFIFRTNFSFLEFK